MLSMNDSLRRPTLNGLNRSPFGEWILYSEGSPLVIFGSQKEGEDFLKKLVDRRLERR